MSLLLVKCIEQGHGMVCVWLGDGVRGFVKPQGIQDRELNWLCLLALQAGSSGLLRTLKTSLIPVGGRRFAGVNKS